MIAPLCSPEIGASTLLGGRYEVDPVPFAIGGSATVHRAVDVRLGRVVAVKRPRDAAAHARLRREAALLAGCAHPGIVGCLDAREDADGAPFVVLQFVDGANLAQHAGASIPRVTARHWARDLVWAVRFLQARGIVHGDLKPQHVVIGRDGHAVLVDFDRAHREGDPAACATGVEAFAAPSVSAGEPTTLASDRYALRALVRWLSDASRERSRR